MVDGNSNAHGLQASGHWIAGQVSGMVLNLLAKGETLGIRHVGDLWALAARGNATMIEGNEGQPSGVIPWRVPPRCRQAASPMSRASMRI